MSGLSGSVHPSDCVLSARVCHVAVSPRLFLHSVLSALLGVGLVLVVASYVFVEFFLDPSSLRTNQHFLGEWRFPRVRRGLVPSLLLS